MRKLIVLPGWCNSLGGTTVSLSMMLRGFEQCRASEQVCVLVWSGSLLEKYLRQKKQAYCLQLISANTQQEFFAQSLRWIAKQPKDWPLLLENCIYRKLLSVLAPAAPVLRLSGRPVYYFFRDCTRSYNFWGNFSRKLLFASLAPQGICNSHYTAQYIRQLGFNVGNILYPAVDTQRFNRYSIAPPANLRPIIATGANIMLTPSRLSKPEIFNDKNLRALIPLLAHLKFLGYHYHGVIIGPDDSSGKERSRELLEQAERLGVADCFTILPPTFSIEDYYQHANVVVTLAPREPFGRTVAEAIACGVPVIGSRTGGIGEILQNFAPAWMVDPNDPEATAKAITNLPRDPNTPNLLAQGRRWVETNCSPDEYARKMMAITHLNYSRITPESNTLNTLAKQRGSPKI